MAPFSLISNSWFPLFQFAEDSLGYSREGEGRGREREREEKEGGKREREKLRGSVHFYVLRLDWLCLGQMINA